MIVDPVGHDFMLRLPSAPVKSQAPPIDAPDTSPASTARRGCRVAARDQEELLSYVMIVLVLGMNANTCRVKAAAA